MQLGALKGPSAARRSHHRRFLYDFARSLDHDLRCHRDRFKLQVLAKQLHVIRWSAGDGS